MSLRSCGLQVLRFRKHSQRSAPRLKWRAGCAVVSSPRPQKRGEMERRAAQTIVSVDVPLRGRRAFRRSIAAICRDRSGGTFSRGAAGGRSASGPSRRRPGSGGCEPPRAGAAPAAGFHRRLPEVFGPNLQPIAPACSALVTPHECAPQRAGCGECKCGSARGDYFFFARQRVGG